MHRRYGWYKGIIGNEIYNFFISIVFSFPFGDIANFLIKRKFSFQI
jgi:hypothetical protein